jgi:hypothetical protein
MARGRCCRLQLLLALASTVVLRSEYGGTHNHISLSQTRDFPKLEGQVPVFISPPPETGWHSYSPRHWVPFSSPPTTRRATVKVFEPATTQVTEHQFTSFLLLLPLREPNRTENIVSNNSPIVAWVSVGAETCLSSRCLAMDVFCLHYSDLQATCHNINKQSTCC